MENDIPEIFGRCRIQKRLGEGAVGTVYLAEHQSLGIPVAVKVVPVRLLESRGQSAERFMREARMAARVRHPNVLRVYDCGEEAGYYYLIMDYIDGSTCNDLIEQRGRFEWREAVRVVLAVAQGLHCAAQAGVIHRDIKPDNIMVDKHGTAQLTDLGLAKSVEAAGVSITREEQLLGTPFYMSPEQIRDARYVDLRSDIYSLGATLYHMVCGVPPFSGSNIFEIMNKHLREPVPSPRSRVPDVPQALCDVIAKTMAKEPADRYQTYDKLIEDLQHVLAGEEVSAAGAESRLQKGFVAEGETLQKLRGGRVFKAADVPLPFTAIGASLFGILCVFGMCAAVLCLFWGLWATYGRLAAWVFIVLAAAGYVAYTVLLAAPRGQYVDPKGEEHSKARILSLLRMLSDGVGMKAPRLCFSPRAGRPCAGYAAPLSSLRLELSERFMVEADPAHTEIIALMAQEVGRFYYGHTSFLTLLDGPERATNMIVMRLRSLLCPSGEGNIPRLALGVLLSAAAVCIGLASVVLVSWFAVWWCGAALLLLMAVGLGTLMVRRYSDYACDMFAAAVMADTGPVKAIIAREALASPRVATALLERTRAYAEKEGEKKQEEELEPVTPFDGEAIGQITYYFSRIQWTGGAVFRLYHMLSDRPFPALRINMLSGIGPRLPVVMRAAAGFLSLYEQALRVEDYPRERFLPEPVRLRPYVILGLAGGLLTGAMIVTLLTLKVENYLMFLATICAVAAGSGLIAARIFRRQHGTGREFCIALIALVLSQAVLNMLVLGLFGTSSGGTALLLQVPTVVVVSLVLASVGATVALRRIQPAAPARRPAGRPALQEAAGTHPPQERAAVPPPADAGTPAKAAEGSAAVVPAEEQPAESHAADETVHVGRTPTAEHLAAASAEAQSPAPEEAPSPVVQDEPAEGLAPVRPADEDDRAQHTHEPPGPPVREQEPAGPEQKADEAPQNPDDDEEGFAPVEEVD
jgi:hypothetical protein